MEVIILPSCCPSQGRPQSLVSAFESLFSIPTRYDDLSAFGSSMAWHNHTLFWWVRGVSAVSDVKPTLPYSLSSEIDFLMSSISTFAEDIDMMLTMSRSIYMPAQR